MAASGDLAAFGRKLDRISADLSGAGMTARLRRVADDSIKDISDAVRRDIGDQSMSGWTRSRPIPIVGVVKVEGNTVSLQPSAAGPMRVLEDGRNQGGAVGMHGPGQFAKDGSTVRKGDGTVKASRKRKGYTMGKVGRRGNGRTRGKNTWSDAVGVMVVSIPKRHGVDVAKTVMKSWGG